MNPSYPGHPGPERTFIPGNVPGNFAAGPSTPTPRGRGAPPGAKRGRKPRGAGPNSTTVSPRTSTLDFRAPQTPNVGGAPPSTQTPLVWAQPVAGPSASLGAIDAGAGVNAPASAPGNGGSGSGGAVLPALQTGGLQLPTGASTGPLSPATTAALQTRLTALSLPGQAPAQGQGEYAALSTPTRATGPGVPSAQVPGAEEEGEEDELLPAMADDDYSAQLSWQSQSKDNLKVLMDNFSETQYDRFEAYRRHALPKQAVRKVIQQTLGQQVSQPVAQIVAGFSKVFVGDMVEKARAVQARRGESGPLSPDHLREAYRMYQEETGRVGAARPVRAKRLFMR